MKSELTLLHLRGLPDDQLMIRLKSGHDDALKILFDRYHRLVLTIAVRIVRDAGEAEDIMQTVFLDIYRAKGQFDPSKGSTKVWLLQYAYHRSINRRQQLESRKFYYQSGDRETHSDGRAASASGRHALPSQESSVLVREAMMTLNEAQKATIELAFFDGLTMQEIAEKTGHTVANVRHHFYRGLEKLRSCLGIKPKRIRDSQGEIAGVES